ncbi:hypothetical protein B0G84_5690 [Paraburkholderia sp. BL8N3]|nr:hypothetical protein [Paraburkholderia sp. BL8N3]TCK36677.1 hypothetical protein B0G84_5690 [Paraburkholderia sp. BL8N3]
MTTHTKKFSEVWDLFAASIPTEAGPLQRDDMRHAFYCGAISLLSIGRHARDSATSPEEVERAVAAIAAELNEYKASLVMDMFEHLAAIATGFANHDLHR